MKQSNNSSISISWIIYSALASLATMVLIAIAIGLSSVWSLIPVTGLLVFLFFLLHNPIGRYLRLSVILIGIWGALVLHSSTNVKLFFKEVGSATIDIGEINILVHVCFIIIILALLVLDYKSRVVSKKQNLTKNRLTLYKWFYLFLTYTITLVLITSVFLITNKVAPIEYSDTTITTTKTHENSFDLGVDWVVFLSLINTDPKDSGMEDKKWKEIVTERAFSLNNLLSQYKIEYTVSTPEDLESATKKVNEMALFTPSIIEILTRSESTKSTSAFKIGLASGTYFGWKQTNRNNNNSLEIFEAVNSQLKKAKIVLPVEVITAFQSNPVEIEQFKNSVINALNNK